MNTYQTDIAHVTFRTFTLPLADLPPVSLARLLQYGYSQMMQDAISGLSKKAEETFALRTAEGEVGKLFETMAENAGLDSEAAREMSQEAFTKAVISGVLTRKDAAIRAGEFSIRQPSEPVDPLEAEAARIASGLIRAAFKAKGAKPPKADDFKALVTRLLSGDKGPGIRKEAKKNLDAAAKAPTIDLTALLGEEGEG